MNYMGHMISKECMQSDPEKVGASIRMSKQENRKKVDRLFGMIKYLEPFIPQLSEITAPIRDLLRKDTEWKWHTEQNMSLPLIKDALSSNPVLKIYDVDKPIKIQTDASSYGLRARLVQKGKPVAHASRSLTTVTSVAQLEHWSPELQLRHAAVALAGRAHVKYRSFVEVIQ